MCRKIKYNFYDAIANEFSESETDMVFSSLIFIYAFLPACLAFYFIAPGIKAKNGILLLFSLFFYAWGEPVWVLLLLFCAAVNYFGGILICRRDGRGRTAALAFSVAISLATLGAFKYLGFLFENLGLLTGAAFPAVSLALPIGISFYTFQSLSYTIDLYRGRTALQKSFLDFLLFVSLFPQLIAGPILRYSDIEAQLSCRKSTWSGISYGISRFLCGLGKKALIANYAGQASSFLLDGELKNLGAVGAWLGILLFAFQIYFDFSGYSDMAIGLGRIFGFRYGENFKFPYMACSVTDFWRTWHISLGAFFRDYLYIPIGGNRRFQLRNILVVWLLTGFWHGASWNFVCWGLYFGVLLLLEKYLILKILGVLPKFFAWCYTFFLVLVGWVLFYFTDMTRAGEMLRAMFGRNGAPAFDFEIHTVLVNNLPLLILCAVACTPVFRNLARPMAGVSSAGLSPPSAVSGLLVLLYNLALLALATTALVGAGYNPFLYFRF
jgi:alginate O-acetyltransferase complex protein AlgI